ncbi:hypothetical protein TNCV_3757761 [Trichonephila clavipes]|nr:hypothetical protein TNCV_3757761 [Trichonephila clavipes]
MPKGSREEDPGKPSPSPFDLSANKPDLDLQTTVSEKCSNSPKDEYGKQGELRTGDEKKGFTKPESFELCGGNEFQTGSRHRGTGIREIPTPTNQLISGLLPSHTPSVNFDIVMNVLVHFYPGTKSIKRWNEMFIETSSVTEDILKNNWLVLEYWLNSSNCQGHTRCNLQSDEAHFWLNGYVNKQNCRIWSEANPQVYVETPLHPEKLTVWCALWAGGVIGPYFFKNDEGHNVTVNGDRYRAMITNFFIPELNNHDVQELWFQQDGATCHTARATIDLLKDTFGDRLISRFGPVNWPPRSCD